MSCNNDSSKKLNENLKKWFKKKIMFPNNDINEFILLLKEVVNLHQYMDEWEKLNETSSPEKKIEQLKYGRYYWCRLHGCKKSL